MLKTSRDCLTDVVHVQCEVSQRKASIFNVSNLATLDSETSVFDLSTSLHILSTTSAVCDNFQNMLIWLSCIVETLIETL